MATCSDELWNLTIAFRAVRIETARLDAEVLLMHVLGIDRTQLLVNLNEPLTSGQQLTLAHLANRRLDGEPIAYLTGYREFMGLDFSVSPDVLIPRPETELLVEWALSWLDGRNPARVIDVGSGSGAIAVSVASNCSIAHEIVATDISSPALEIARKNANRLVPDRITFLQSDLLSTIEVRFDLILANLPYLTPQQIAESPSIAREPRLALDGGEAGITVIDRLIRQIPSHLAEGGAVGLELDPGHAVDVRALLASELPGYAIEIREDLSGLDRFVLASARI